MAQPQQRLNVLFPIVEESGVPSQTFKTWALKVSNNMPLVASGSPEGQVTAAQYTLYIDESVPLTPIQYRKMLPEVGGDRSKGWAAI